MSKVWRTTQAEFDLLEIWTFVARDSLAAADKLIRAIDAKMQYLADNPTAGEKLDQIREGLRASPVGKYVVYYLATGDGIQVYRVLHGARNRDAIL
jgi:toxin ParE1/3/4